MIDKYLNEYLDKFGENFPIFGFMGIPDDEIIKTIKKCLKTGKPYVLKTKDGEYL